MRNIITTTICILIMVGLLGFNTIKFNYEVRKNTAEVNKIEGLYIFTDSEPVSDYEYLGTVKTNIFQTSNSQYEGVREGLIKQVKKKYPNANGALLYLNYGQSDKADAIKLK